MNKKLKTVFTVLSIGSLGLLGYPYIAEKLQQTDSASALLPGAASMPKKKSAQNVSELSALTPGEAIGLMIVGAQNKDVLATISDPRDLCNVVKSNAILNNAAGGNERFSKEFESCANRTLQYEAAFLQAGSIIGVENIPTISEADFCGVTKIAALRAVMKYKLEAGKPIPSENVTLQNVNDLLEKECASKGEFNLSAQLWNDYANRAVIFPFYQRTTSSPAP